ncbi:hypothetical protein [Motilimonas eburnea]|uniref:hypothetical protein n=1 Tax=Motilimonas eburnea TaxID=1737488 RepID=UPI001E46AA90|nr:hypothetical protein [Motilimonas eburnea]MCE2571777.1 hypothetical protein [Motilimonas eburnea]
MSEQLQMKLIIKRELYPDIHELLSNFAKNVRAYEVKKILESTLCGHAQALKEQGVTKTHTEQCLIRTDLCIAAAVTPTLFERLSKTNPQVRAEYVRFLLRLAILGGVEESTKTPLVVSVVDEQTELDAGCSGQSSASVEKLCVDKIDVDALDFT